jgi:hypothetical protein
MQQQLLLALPALLYDLRLLLLPALHLHASPPAMQCRRGQAETA